MTTEHFAHFEQLWEYAERISQQNTLSKQEIFLKLNEVLSEYNKLDNIPSKDIQNVLKTKQMGEILFLLCHLSRIDNINTFAALQLVSNYKTDNEIITQQ